MVLTKLYKNDIVIRHDDKRAKPIVTPITKRDAYRSALGGHHEVRGSEY